MEGYCYLWQLPVNVKDLLPAETDEERLQTDLFLSFITTANSSRRRFRLQLVS
jgi:hypothetical protein